MTTTTIPPTEPEAKADEVAALIRDRTERGYAYWREFGAEFVEVKPGIVRVPSRSNGGQYYDIDIAPETCGCPDYIHRTSKHGVGCAHVFAVAVASARRRTARRAIPCDACGCLWSRHDLMEIMPEHAEHGAYDEGMRVCPPCAYSGGAV